MFNLGMGEITVILLLALIFLGPSKLPELATGLGRIIRQIRKTTSDVKNEIVLDDTIRRPFEELRDAITLHPDELKRRDQIRQSLDDARKQAEEIERATAEAAANAGNAGSGNAGSNDGQATPPPEPIAAGEEASAPWPPPPNAPAPPVAPPVGTFPRSPTPAPLQPGRLGGPRRVTPPISSLDGKNANITQVLSEEDLLPARRGGPPPPPPPLPGVAPPPPPKKA